MAGSGQEDAMQRAVGTVLVSLPSDRDLLPDQVAEACEDVQRMFSRRGDVLDLAALIREVMHRVTVWQAPSTGLDDNTDHVEWLPAAKAGIDWRFWERYRRYQEEVKLMPRQSFGDWMRPPTGC